MKLNPWLQEKLKGRDPRGLRVIVEVDPKAFDEVLLLLKRMGYRVVTTSFNRFITVVVPEVADIERIERIPGVVEVHYDMPKWIRVLRLRDPLLGEVKLSQVEVPGIPTVLLPPLGKVKRPDVKIVPTSVSKKWVVDIETTLTGKSVKVCVIDTGVNPFHPQVIGSKVEVYTTVPEPPLDGQGHGHWCSMTVYGRPFNTRFGRVEGIAANAYKMHVKALTTLGFGTTTSVLKAMEIALKRRAKIVSMSLGGPQQGPVDHDPECKAAKILHDHGILVVVAAGNEGPNKWTIASPGVCPWVLTVGAASITDEGEVAWFSSRGPQGDWYARHRADWQEDYNKYGDLLVKPDVVAPGGGRRRRNDKPDEVLYQGCTGWFDGYYDLAPDLFEGMHGTSQATPHVSGLLALLAEAYPGIRMDQIKRVIAVTEKSIDSGWGLVKLSMFVR